MQTIPTPLHVSDSKSSLIPSQFSAPFLAIQQIVRDDSDLNKS